MKAIVIMACTRSPIYLSWDRPKCVFDGTMKDAKAYCDELNKKATKNYYEPVRVDLKKPKS